MINSYGQDIDAMWEADAAAEWEEINDCDFDPYPVIHKLEEAYHHICEAMAAAFSAAKEAEGEFAYEDRATSIGNEMDTLSDEITDLIRRMQSDI